MVRALTLTHTPLGLEHPYEQNLTERFPRFPVAGERITLGVATTPVGGVDSVTASWRVKTTGKEGIAKGVWHKSEADNDYWKIQLPAFDAKSEISYRLSALGSQNKITSETFEFEVFNWEETGDLITYKLGSSSIQLTCAMKNNGLNAQMLIEVVDEHRMRFQVGTGTKDDPAFKTQPALNSISAGVDFHVIQENKDRVLFESTKLKVIVYRSPYHLEVRHLDGEPILVEKEPAKWLAGARGGVYQVQQVFECLDDEAFYGFGERFNAINQRGNVLDTRVYEQYKNQGLHTYLPIPFFISNHGYGIYFDTPRNVIYDLASSDKRRWSFQAELDNSNGLEYELICNRDPKAIIETFANLTSLPVLPPAWVFGPWMSSNEWDNQALVLEQVKQSLELGIPVTVLVIEAWSDEATFYIWNDAQYIPKSSDRHFSYSDFIFPAKGKWPDPKGMTHELHKKGLKVLLWQIPVLRKVDPVHPQNKTDETYMIEKGYCVKDETNQPYRVRPPWFKGGLVLDFINPEATQWWLNKRTYLLDELNIDGFKTDGGEHLWGRDLHFSDGRRGAEIWNLYPNLYAQAYHQILKDKKGDDAITFSRSGFTGAQQFPCHWAGDADSTWEAFRSSILAGLNAGLSGIPFWGWDIAGFSGEVPSAELYLRATAMATFCPIMQYHSEYNDHREPSNDRTPWNIQERTGDKEVIPVYRKYANLRMNLLPYIYSQAKESSMTGFPLMRALPLEFGNDRECENHPYQYLFGDSLLVAPVISEGAQSQKIYIPLGDWYDFWTNRCYSGPLLVNYPTTKDTIPVFVRAGAALPLNLNETYELGNSVGNATDHYKNLALRFYPGHEGVFTSAWFDFVSRQYYRVEWKVLADESIHIELPPIPHDITLIVVHPSCSTILMDDKGILISKDLGELRMSTETTGYRDPERELTYLKLRRKNLSRTIVMEK
ncbi:MAG: hypothetical protein M1347_07700 [Chloroflexi bacterium]|nr:hypothetical protein [Chloroflexota bacterium]